MYNSDSDENIRRYRLGHKPLSSSYQQQHLIPRPSSTLSLNQIHLRRMSNPDIYPGRRRYSTSFSDDDILSNDQLDQIHFDPRYRDYRSASSLNNSNYRSRSNSLHSMASTGNVHIQQYQPYRRVSSQSPPLLVPLIPQKRWDTNPSIFIEEYRDEDEAEAPKSESLKSENSNAKRDSKETICTSNDSLQPALSVYDIKSFGDLSEIPFIDDDSNETAPCRVLSETELSQKNSTAITSSIVKNTGGSNTCRKTVSFDMLKSGPSQQRLYSTAGNGKNFPQTHNKLNPQKKFYYTDKSHPPQLFHASDCAISSQCPPCISMHHCHHHHHNRRQRYGDYSSRQRPIISSNVRRTKDGYVIRSQSVPKMSSTSSSTSSSSSSSSSNDDHCTLMNKLISLKMEEKHLKCESSRRDEIKKDFLKNYKIQWDETNGNETNNDKICSGKVKALTTYFNSLPFMSTDCNCTNIIHQSTPNLSITTDDNNNSCNANRLSHDEMALVRKQLKEWSEFGLKKQSKKNDKLVCSFVKEATSSPKICLENEVFGGCKQYREVLNRLDKVKMRHHSQSLNDLDYIENPQLPDCFVLTKASQCKPNCDNIENLPIDIRAPFSFNFGKHKCRSPCYSIKRDSLKERKKKATKSKAVLNQLKEPSPPQDDNESLII